MFNWSTAPTFAVMLLFWLLASYILTRSPRSLISLAAVGAQVAAAAYLLGQGMQANAQTLDEWRPWARNLLWGATLAPTLWYWLTLLLLREQPEPSPRSFLRWIGFPIGAVAAVLSLVATAGVYIDNWFFQWNAPLVVPGNRVAYSHYSVRGGPLFPLLLTLLLITTFGAALNVGLGWRWTRESARRRRFAWLFLSAILFLAGANILGVASTLHPRWNDREIIPAHLMLGAAMLAMAWNVVSYSLLLKGQVIRKDALYFLSSLTTISLMYAAVLTVFIHNAYRFDLLGLFMIVIVLAILSHALVDVGRRALDPLFFASEVGRLRSNLATVMQDAVLTTDLDVVLEEAQKEIGQVSLAHLIHLTEEALRRLNNPTALARCEILGRLPRTLRAAAEAKAGFALSDVTPLQQAQLLRETLILAIERLKPPDAATGSPAALHYQILSDEYRHGLPNKQIITRLSISESTFHRNRREAIAALARELDQVENLLPADVL